MDVSRIYVMLKQLSLFINFTTSFVGGILWSTDRVTIIYSNLCNNLCINQIISITHEIYKSFDDGYEIRSVFLDISKAFDKVWHQGLHYKLRQNGISGELLNILTDFLDNRT